MAQSIVGTALATNWHALYARPSVAVYCDWNMDGDYADASENITAYVSAVHGEHRLYDPLVGLPMLGGTKTSTATVVCENSSDFFSPDNAAGLAGTYTAVANGYYRVPIIIDMGYLTSGGSPEVLRQFTGVIEIGRAHV